MPKKKKIILFITTKKTPNVILSNVNKYFGIDIEQHLTQQDSDTWKAKESRLTLKFVRLQAWPTYDDWQVCWSLFDCLWCIIASLEAMARCEPRIFLDSELCWVTAAVASKVVGCRSAFYIHYPKLNPMTQSSAGKSAVKSLYYESLCRIYSWTFARADLILVNSNWTRTGIRHYFDVCEQKMDAMSEIKVIYPPCDLHSFRVAKTTECISSGATPKSGLTSTKQQTPQRKNWILSCGRISYEKNYMLQLESMKILKEKYEKEIPADTKWIICGAITADLRLYETLISKIREYGLSDMVEIRTGLSFRELVQTFQQSKVFLHNMVDEHFGISVVDALSAGLLPVAHNSGGPKMDILAPLSDEEISASQNIRQFVSNDSEDDRRIGFLSITAEEFSDNLRRALVGYDSDQAILSMRSNADIALKRFNTIEAFGDKFINDLLPKLGNCDSRP